MTDYSVTLLDIAMQTDPKAGVPPGEIGPGLRIYPNPATTEVFVEPGGLQSGPMELHIISVEGTLLMHRIHPYAGTAVSIDLEGFSPGYYLLRVSDGNQVLTAPLLIQ